MSPTTLKLGLSAEAVSKMQPALVALLADEHVLYVKTRNYHWNVTGAGFYATHRFFEELYDKLSDRIDDIAERLRSLGHVAPGAMKTFLAQARLTEDTTVPTQLQMMTHLLTDHETLIRQLRTDIALANEVNDTGTADFLTGLIEAHEKEAWLLRAHLG